MHIETGTTHLIDQNWDKEVVNEKALREFSKVIAKEEHREDNDEELVWRVCEGTAEHLDTAHDDDECRDASHIKTLRSI